MNNLDSYTTCCFAFAFACFVLYVWLPSVDKVKFIIIYLHDKFARCMLVNVVADGHCHGYTPRWFVQEEDAETGNLIHRFTGEYWQCKEKQDWSRCPDIYL